MEKNLKQVPEEFWKEKLTEEQYEIVRLKGTEIPFTGELLHNKEDGIYKCIACGSELFKSDTKFDSGSGWPSFYDAIDKTKIELKDDSSHGMKRSEVICANCGAHLGHVFEDGPRDKTGLRYCINSVALDFEKSKTNSIVLGGGCFWCIEAIFQRIKGVEKVTSGYSGGEIENPDYNQISNGDTGYVEVIKVEYNPDIITLKEIFSIFFNLHDPTTLNRQGNDVGEQYRSVIFYENEEQKNLAKEVLEKSQADYTDKIVTTIEELKNFYNAESYHQNYYASNKNAGYCKFIIDPKIRKLYKDYKAEVKEEYKEEMGESS